MKRILRTLLLLGFLLSAIAQPRTTNPVHWSLKLVAAKKTYRKGQIFTARLTAQIAAGWHLYGLEEVPNGPRPTQITLADEQPFTLAGTIQSPRPRTKFDENFGVETLFYTGAVTFLVPLKIRATAPTGTTRLHAQVRYQTCNDHLCLPPKTVTLKTSVTIH